MSADLHLRFRFGVFFFVGGIAPNPLDIRFQRVSGLSADIQLKTFAEGGQNLYSHRVPQSISYGNLVLERGMIVGSPLNIEFNATLTTFEFLPSNVLVTLFGESKAPVAGWMFMNAYPVRWSTSDLNAAETGVVIDTMELAYTRMQILRV